jgi:tetratricopeptide (TPR) repeat protein
MFFRLGVYDKARAYYQSARQIQQEIGARQSEVSAWFNLGLVHHSQGDHKTAWRRIQQALEIALTVGDRRAQGFAWMGLGHAFWGLEALDRAHEAYHESITLWRELGQEHLVVEPLAGLARVALAFGKTDQAQEQIEEILGIIGNCEHLDGLIDPFHICLTCFQVLRAIDDRRALDILRHAHQQLQERAARISDEELRRSFLENVPSHREVTNAWEKDLMVGAGATGSISATQAFGTRRK